MKQRIILGSLGVILLISLFLFGKTESPKPPETAKEENALPAFDVQTAIRQEKQNLTSEQLLYITSLENGITRGDLKKQEKNQYTALADFWKDSVPSFVPYAYYISESAKLENSKKSLTFAARLILENMRRETRTDVKVWEAQTAADLFEKALELDPDNDDLKVGLGSCYVFGEGMIGDASQTMKGIQQLLEVVKKDSNNMQAQLVLGIGAEVGS